MAEVDILRSGQEIDPEFEKKLIEDFFHINPDQSKIKITRVKFALSPKQREELLVVADSQNYKHHLIIRTLLETGLRVNELVNLTIPDLNLVEMVLTVQSRNANQYVQSFKTKTKSSNRQIPLTKDIVKELKSFIGNRKNGYVFESNKTQNGYKRFTTYAINHFINKYAKKCTSLGKSIGVHATRRTYASFLIEKSVPISVISELMGHSCVRTTMDYIFGIRNPTNYDKVREAIEDMNPNLKNIKKGGN